jgi:hypothetical protein
MWNKTSVLAASIHPSKNTNLKDLQFNRIVSRRIYTMPHRRNPVAKAAVVHHHREKVGEAGPVAKAAVVHHHREEVKEDKSVAKAVEQEHREEQVKKAAVIHHHRKKAAVRRVVANN